MNVLIIPGHPRTDSLCGALADAYGKGTREAGTEVRRLDMATLDFDPTFTLFRRINRPLNTIFSEPGN